MVFQLDDDDEAVNSFECNFHNDGYWMVVAVVVGRTLMFLLSNVVQLMCTSLVNL